MRQGFTGYEKDAETGLNFAQARYHSPTQGRFTSVDPLSGVLIRPQSWNKYAYCLNNPLVFVDPTGLRRAQRAGSDGNVSAYEWFDDKADDNGNSAYSNALNNGWSAVTFDESQSFTYTANTGIGGERFSSYVLNPDGTHGWWQTLNFGGAGVVPDFGAQMAMTGIAQGAGNVLFSLKDAVRGLGSSLFGRQAATEAAEGGGTSLYRAVTQGEVDDILATGTYRTGGTSIEGKYFFESADDAAGFAK